ncbi:membrane protein [Sphingomonas swuensis]|uniref:Membrane protein n=1 Tax=Sphingomonas swuensis TaxID=977800 RepID=A0ABP7SRD8_9SPHN
MERTATAPRVIHPVHAALLAAILPLFLGALLADWAYSSSYQVQWINFGAWLNAGALVFAGFALLWAVIDFFRADRRRDPRSALYLLALIATFVVGFIGALVHAKDAWASMPAALILSLVTFVLALASVWLGFATLRNGAAR